MYFVSLKSLITQTFIIFTYLEIWLNLSYLNLTFFHYCTLHILAQAMLKIKHTLIIMTGLVFHIFPGVSYFLMLTKLDGG